MVFSSMTFLCVFLPIVFLLYYLIPSLKGRNRLLVIVSLLFYAYGEPVYVLLMLVSTILNYIFGRALGTLCQRTRKLILVLSILCNLSMLLVFKYADMLIGTTNLLFHTDIKMPDLSLPIGISFFTFQAMSYVIDVYRGDVEYQKNYWDILLYISFFPQLIAGPIVKYHDVRNQIAGRNASLQEIAEGFRRFSVGLGKKVLISNTMAAAADHIFQARLEDINICGAWVGTIAYTLQIYYDFSGYSDMAIGLGHIFGFSFLENFQWPYISRSIQEFWRRWHISLSTWFKEYLYIPLGGNRKGNIRTCVNKIIVFFCTGLWHGANWTFIIWGLFHGLFLMLEEIIPLKKLPGILGHIYTMFVVGIGFVIFRADTLGQSIGMVYRLFFGWEFNHNQTALVWEQLTPVFLVILAIALAGCVPWKKYVQGERYGKFQPVSYLLSLFLLILCMLSLAGGTYNPFIYFRF